jgi:hypothetical protein
LPPLDYRFAFGFNARLRWKRKRALRPLQKAAQGTFWQIHLPLHRFLPSIRQRSHPDFTRYTHRPRLKMQKPHLYFQNRIYGPCNEALNPHTASLFATLRLAVNLRIHHSKIPALLIFHRRRPVRI